MSNLENVNTDNKSHAAEEVRRRVDDLNEISNGANAAFLTGWKQTYHFIGQMARWVHAVLEDNALLQAVYGLANERGVPLPGGNDNAMLVFVRLACGEFKDGKWCPDRTAEHYAPVVRHFLAIGTPPEDIQNILVERREISDGKGGTVKATIAGIKRADRELQSNEDRKRTVFTEEAKADAAKLKPLAEVNFPDLEKSFTFCEGYALAIVRLHGGKLQVLGDSGKKDNDVLRVVKARTEALSDQGPAKSAQVPDIKEVRLKLGMKVPVGA